MSNIRRGALAIFIFSLATFALTACEQSVSQAPAATPTLLPTGLFVSPFPSVASSLDMIATFAQQTSAAQTAAAGGGATGTPGTPDASTTGTVIIPQTGVTVTPGSVTITPGTPTNSSGAIATTPVAPITPGGPSATPIPPGVRPATYVLQSGEHPFCIGRRFNVDPDLILSLSGITRDQANNLPSGTVLTIPQSGSFPGDRPLLPHPSTYSVLSSDETVYSVACKYGDVDPAALASANGISVSAKLTAGQQLKIP